jgi:hypothetical protein
MVKVKTKTNGKETRGTAPKKIEVTTSFGRKLAKQLNAAVNKVSSFKSFIK